MSLSKKWPSGKATVLFWSKTYHKESVGPGLGTPPQPPRAISPHTQRALINQRHLFFYKKSLLPYLCLTPEFQSSLLLPPPVTILSQAAGANPLVKGTKKK